MYFIQSDIDDELYKRMLNRSYHPNDQIAISDLSYLKILYYNFHHKQCIGELIVHKKIALPTLQVFMELFEARYPIEKIRLIDEYNGDDYRSMSDNNSSAFNYRCIDGTNTLSNHSKGLAIDINPLYNPYVKTVDQKLRILPPESSNFLDRTINNPYFIKQGDCCYNAFIKHGFTWGGNWTHCKDYQHFEYIE